MSVKLSSAYVVLSAVLGTLKALGKCLLSLLLLKWHRDNSLYNIMCMYSHMFLFSEKLESQLLFTDSYLSTGGGTYLLNEVSS